MPTRRIVQQFIETVERGDTLRAIEQYYADDASLQENGGTPKTGKATLIAREHAMLERVAHVQGRAQSYLLDGDRVAIHWRFEGTLKDGTAFTLDEIAYQQWTGDTILRERFFYDPR